MQKIQLILITSIVAALLTACGGNQPAPTPTISIADVQTMAVSTFISNLTQTAQAMPTEAPTDTPAPTNTILAFNTFAPLNGSGTPIAVLSSPTGSCYRLLFVNDVTIPDDTPMTPGQKFTKTWLVQNTGGCPWQTGFKWTVVGGDPMGGSTYVLPQAVAPQQQIQVSVSMIAPNNLGKVRGTWRMSDINGNFFGDAPWVEILVTNATVTPGSETATPANTSIPTVTATATP